MIDELRKTYLRILFPAIAALLLAYPIKKIGLIPLQHNLPLTVITPFFFVLAVFFAIALPIFNRSLFVNKIRKQKSVSKKLLINFERQLIIISLIPSYMVVIAYFLSFSNFYFSCIVLVALYSAYYFYPSKKRIQFEKNLFRVQE